MTALKSKNYRTKRIFFALPEDVGSERRLIPRIIRRLNKSEANFLNINLVAVVQKAEKRNERSPLEDLKQADPVILVLWKEQGERTGRFSSFFRAMLETARRENKRVFLFFRDIPDEILADPDSQAAKTIDLRDQLEKEGYDHIVWYEDEYDWEEMLYEILTIWLNKGTPERPIIDHMENHRTRLEGLARAFGKISNKTVKKALSLARQAFKYAESGRLTKACQSFARAIDISKEPYLMNEYGIFLKNNGFLNKSMLVFDKMNELGQLLDDKMIMGSAIRHKGDISRLNKDLLKAQDLYRHALGLEKSLGRDLKEAYLFQALGITYLDEGAYDPAMEMIEKASAVFVKADFKEGAALMYFNLAGIFAQREDVDNTILMAEKSLSFCREVKADDMIEKLEMIMEKLKEIKRIKKRASDKKS